MKYAKFGAMIITSTIAMFIMMYLNTYAMSHIWFSETRTYMAVYMGAVMAIIMLAFMLGMYNNKKLNAAIFIGAIILFATCLYLVRSQNTVSDVSYMKAMIPHHSIAILTSEHSNIEDARVRELADGIIKAQRKEIKEMEWLIQDIEQQGKLTTEAAAKARAVPEFKGNLNKGDQNE
ncbi:MAG: DUF305 domain-containing protein [Rheinheimera sp.]|uniref:DUF305 domain-containing protein n=1 Tax=Arsukibacterium sp. UBA3155 TaxID=1946058 RepID=UPI000C98929A|nr:DUF305 domain-containing protein [Arsukibacterium sp. UBA3155]MAD76053.1 DUF305 domain-containing protein [Rheinheimera sp.]|tara:strand:+ start:103984 stop:104514 length:531 start_codon:yes stop_codon:yes gene_type:complete